MVLGGEHPKQEEMNEKEQVLQLKELLRKTQMGKSEITRYWLPTGMLPGPVG